MFGHEVVYKPWCAGEIKSTEYLIQFWPKHHQARPSWTNEVQAQHLAFPFVRHGINDAFLGTVKLLRSQGGRSGSDGFWMILIDVCSLWHEPTITNRFDPFWGSSVWPTSSIQLGWVWGQNWWPQYMGKSCAAWPSVLKRVRVFRGPGMGFPLKIRSVYPKSTAL